MATSTVQTSVEQFELSAWTPSGPSRSATQTSDNLYNTVPRSGHTVLSTDNITSDETVIQELKPVDGGVAAWTVLITAFVFEAVLWGTHSASFRCQLTHDRLPHLLRCLRRILLHRPRIFIQLLQNSSNRNPRSRPLLPRRTLLRNNRQAFPTLPTSTNLDRLAPMHPRPCMRVFHNHRRRPNHHPGNNVRLRVRDALLSYH
jgi:hypothetical protein